MAQPKDDIVADLLATSKITPSQAHECLVVNDWNPQNAMLYFHMQAADRAEFIEYSWGYEERGGTTAYSETEQRMLEREYQTADYGTKTVQLSVEGQRCQVNVVTLTQTSSLGLSQRVSRTPNVPPDWQDKNAPSYGNVDQLLDAIHNAGQPVDKPAVWFSIDPRTHATHNYSKVDSAAIEASYQTPGFGQDLHLQIFGNTFRVDVGGKKQWNNTGGYRSIGRRPNEPPEWLEGTAFKALSGEEAKRQYQSALDSIATIDAAVEAVRKNPMDRSAVDALEATHSSSASSVLSVYEEILHHLQDADLQARFHGNGLSDMALFSIPPGSDVPSYFANVSSGESIYRRKVLSVLGLRNMVLKGAAIFRDLQEELFIGNEASYARDKGLPLMRRLTGNTVDLDEVVLRCDEATLKCVNQANAAAGKPQYQNGSAFGNSVQAREIAIDSARSVLEVFIQDLKLTDAQQQRRCVVPPQSGDEVPLATQNNDRAKYPVWHYKNAGQNTFHVNAPNFRDIVGSLLLAPWHAVKAYCLICLRAEGDAVVQKRSDYFEKCIEDSCFNGKWKSIDLYLTELQDDLTISKQLAQIEQAHQQIFGDLDDDDAYGAKLLELAKAASVHGSNHSGVDAAVSAEDVTAHMKRFAGTL